MEPVFPHNPSPSQSDTREADMPAATSTLPKTPLAGKLANFLDLMDDELAGRKAELPNV